MPVTMSIEAQKEYMAMMQAFMDDALERSKAFHEKHGHQPDDATSIVATAMLTVAWETAAGGAAMVMTGPDEKAFKRAVHNIIKKWKERRKEALAASSEAPE